MISARDRVDLLASDLKAEQRVDRCLVVEEIAKWMFGRPIHDQLREATGC